MLDFLAKKYLYKRAALLKHYCHYHPISPAKWACDSCHIYYDRTCMPDADEPSRLAFCPHCSQSMRYLSVHHDPQPYWQAAGQFFRLPFQAESLFVMVVLTLVSMVYGAHFISSILSASFIFFCLSQYASLNAQSIQHASKEAPGLNLLLSIDNIKANMGITLVFSFCLLMPVALYKFLGPLAGFILAVFTLSALPALIMSQLPQVKTPERCARTKSSTDLELGPSPSWYQIIEKMHTAYLGLVAYVALAFVITLIISDFAQQYLPSMLMPVLTTGALAYFSLSIFGIFAYVMRQNNAFLPDLEPTKKSAEKSKLKSLHDGEQLKRLDADIDIAIKGGNYAETISLLENELKRNSQSDLRRYQLYQLLIAKNDLPLLEKHGQLFLRLMLGRGQVEQMDEFIGQLRQHNPRFVLYDLSLSVELAELFHQTKKYSLVLWLAHEAEQRFDPAPELAELYLRAAKTLLSKYNRPQQAQQYLDYIKRHFADEPVGESAKILQQHIRKTLAAR